MYDVISDSNEQTIKIASEFANKLQAGDIVFLEGDLGAGKTTFVKGLLQGLGGDLLQVNSPTFIIMNQYQARVGVYHFDCYRLDKQAELLSINFDEYFFGSGISLIEWPFKLGPLLPQPTWVIRFMHINENQRRIQIEHQ